MISPAQPHLQNYSIYWASGEWSRWWKATSHHHQLSKARMILFHFLVLIKIQLIKASFYWPFLTISIKPSDIYLNSLMSLQSQSGAALNGWAQRVNLGEWLQSSSWARWRTEGAISEPQSGSVQLYPNHLLCFTLLCLGSGVRCAILKSFLRITPYPKKYCSMHKNKIFCEKIFKIDAF